MTSYDRESDLLAPVIRYLRKRGYRHFGKEVPFFEQRIDVYGYSDALGLSVAVELKLRRWRYALKQSMLYQLCSDLVLIAMPDTNVRIVDQKELAANGIGLIAVCADGRCRQVASPQHSDVVRKRYRDAYVELVRRERPDA